MDRNSVKRKQKRKEKKEGKKGRKEGRTGPKKNKGGISGKVRNNRAKIADKKKAGTFASRKVK